MSVDLPIGLRFAVRGPRKKIWYRLAPRTRCLVPLFIASDFQFNFLEFKVFFIENMGFAFSSILPCCNICKLVIVSEGFSLGCLIFFPEMGPARFFSI